MTFKHATITPQQSRAWEETRVALLWQCPAFTHVMYTMMDKAGSEHIAVFTPDIPIAATDGETLLLNPETFFKYNLSQRVFIVAHEIMHCILNHCVLGRQFTRAGKVGYKDGSSLPYDPQMMNVATDLVINSLLKESKIGEFHPDWLLDEKIATGKDAAIDVYAKIYKQQQGKDGTGQSGKSFDEHLVPGSGSGKDEHTATTARNDQEWQTAITAGVNAAKAQGKLPAGLAVFFDQVLNPEVPWADKVQAFFARKVGSGSYDWRRADRRLVMRDIYAPGRSGHGAGTVVVAVDTSGSIISDKGLMDRFMGELSGILEEVRPKRMLVMWIDADVHSVDEIDEPNEIRLLKPKGGGGTDFSPAFKWLDNNHIVPDALVYLTDGYGSFPQNAPSYPVLWGNVSENLTEGHYPFGEVVTVPTTKN
jgi:predicted metal-dependent peptidase